MKTTMNLANVAVLPVEWPPRTFGVSTGVLLLALVLLAPKLQALEGSVELGSVVLTEESMKYGEYTGLTDDKAYAVFNFDIRDVTEDGQWQASGDNLGLDSRSIELRFRQPGRRSLRFGYRELPYNRSRDGRVPFAGVGSDVLTLPVGWVAASSTAGMTGLEAALVRYEDATKRKQLSLDYAWFGSDSMTGSIAYSHEIKEGLKTHGGVIGNTGGNPRAVTLPTPVDYTQDELQMKIAWSANGRHAQFGYTLSRFKNSHDSTQWQNPYAAISGWDSAAGYPSGYGSLAQEPDNLYQQLHGMLRFRLSQTTVASADFSYALFEQDDDFQPYTVNPALSVTTSLPRSSLDGEVALSRFRVHVSSRLSSRLQVALKAAYENRDNDTPRDQYIYIGGDSQDQDNASSSRARSNLPHSHRERSLELSGNYRLPNQRRFGLRYQVAKKNRDFSEVERTNENKLKLSYSDSSLRSKHLRLSYSKESRRASAYRGDATYLASHSAAYVSGQPADERFENLPQLRKFHLASRDRDQVFARVAWEPVATVSAGINLAFSRDDYTKSEFGLTEAGRRLAAIDISHVPDEDLDINVFFSRERIKSEQAGRSFRGFAVATDSVNPDRNWRTETDDTVATAGVVLNWRGLMPGAELGVNYMYSRATGRIDTTTGAALTSLPLPDLVVQMRNVSAHMRYALSKRSTVKLGVAHERYASKDFRYDGIGPATLANVIGGGQQSPDYSFNAVSLTFKHSLR